MNKILSQTAWASTVRRGEKPTQSDLRDHLLAVHSLNAGFTESCAMRCRNNDGRNTYEWLADVIDPAAHRSLMDLACGSGPLIALCHQRHGSALDLAGVDMSADELQLLRDRLPDGAATLHHGMAQDLGAFPPGSVDVVLCHWALTLMDPVEPVLTEVNRILARGGVFAAVVDGDMNADDLYRAVHDIIHTWVTREFPHYDEFGIGDVRIRQRSMLAPMVQSAFADAEVSVDQDVFELQAGNDVLAREAAGFFYSSFVLSAPAHAGMLAELEAMFAARGASRFSMPVNRLVVRNRP
ncbi:methyltransferase domain-containing protein [Acuticoccus sp. MNP-M23]|uniref:class I SAM-dependent methyltransferase n=1 Tax=Acuticoccus sp. MNP-M23 TaxID=3072793 RepID=UPI002815732F|nr:methyltransferase domain-containing protein [Acuticoccus sp. MNP-M23]WMS44659.1 methyltransferase domain-containing protein [Acuticoccus sp. MNP-M23]